MTIRFDSDDGIAVLTLDRPEVLNAMDPSTYAEIGAAFDRIEHDPRIYVGIVTGAEDRAFSAGADLKTMHTEGHAPPEWAPWRPDRWDFGQTTSKPLIAAVNGYALAGGLELALVCDIRIAAEHARFGTPEVRWNLLHGYGAYRLPRVIGLSNAMELLLTGEPVDAETALRIGLVSRVVAAEALMPTAMAIAGKVCANGPTAIRMTKELVQRGFDNTLEGYLRLLRMYYDRLDQSADQREGLRAFTEKRDPTYGAPTTLDKPAQDLEDPS